jgi:acetyl-CoA C-acetyltransferase
MAQGIKDKVAILGVGCSKFGERWDASPEDLMVEAYTEAMADAGVTPEQFDAAWFSTHMDDVGTGRGGTPLSIALRLPNIGVTRVENFCAGGSEAIRAAVYAVAAGACDIALAVGVEKLKDAGYGGLPVTTVGTYIPQWYPNAVAPANFAQLATAYRSKHGVDAALLKRAISRVSIKSHANGAKNPKAHFQSPITEEQALKAPIIAEPLGLYDCAGVSDGAAAVIVARPDIARGDGQARPRDLQGAAAGRLQRLGDARQRLGRQLRAHRAHRRPARLCRSRHHTTRARQISMTEVHDCFSITELVTMEDLGPVRRRRRGARRARRSLRRRRRHPVPDRRRPEVLRPPRSVPAASACCTRWCCSCRAAPGRGS